MKLENFKHVLIQTHELGDSNDKGALQRDRLVDRRLTAAAAAKEDCAASHRYNSNSPRRCCRAVCILVAGTSEGTYSKRLKRQKKRHTSKKGDKRSKSKHTRDSLTVGRFSSTASA